MKKFKLEITIPCHENLDKMQTNAQGFYCSSCAKNVIDLSNKTDYEISRIISAAKDKNNICARMLRSQMTTEFELFEQSKNNASLKYASAIAASVLLSTGVVGQEKVETNVEKPKTEQTDKTVMGDVYMPLTEITIKGKVLDSITKKPIYARLLNKDRKITFCDTNKETGEYSFTISNYDSKIEVYLAEIAGISFPQKSHERIVTIAIDKEKIVNNVFEYDIVAPEYEVNNFQYLGGSVDVTWVLPTDFPPPIHLLTTNFNNIVKYTKKKKAKKKVKVIAKKKK